MPGIYIHIPFCKQACHYCNFHFSTSLALKDKMVEAIIKEIHLDAASEDRDQPTEIISTVYFGGGTPSMLEPGELKPVFEALNKRFVFSADMEVTLEANPDDIDEMKLSAWRSLGINRLSVGIQSFEEEELIWMNRAHNAQDSIRCLKQISAAGFTNYSVDLIYGSPLLSDENWKKNVDLVLENNIPHISCYALTVEPGTALNKMISLGKKEAVDADKQARQFLQLINWMELAGYDHYEISNFAKPGMRSRHNSSYWCQTPLGSGEKYYAFGPGAHAFDGKKRKWNLANNALYIQSIRNGIIPFEEEQLTEKQRLNEYIMTSLRTREGLDLSFVEKFFGAEDALQIANMGNRYVDTGKLKNENGKLVLTREGKLFADGIAADLFF